MTNREHENTQPVPEHIDPLELDKETLKDLEPNEKGAEAKGGIFPTLNTCSCVPKSFLVCVSIK